MRSAELLAYGVEEPLSGRLAIFAQDHGLWYRPVQHEAALRSVLAKGSCGIVLIRLGRDLSEELRMVREVVNRVGDVTIIVLGDDDHPLLEGMTYDLGATAVLFPPRGVDELFEMLTLVATQIAK